MQNSGFSAIYIIVTNDELIYVNTTDPFRLSVRIHAFISATIDAN